MIPETEGRHPGDNGGSEAVAPEYVNVLHCFTRNPFFVLGLPTTVNREICLSSLKAAKHHVRLCMSGTGQRSNLTWLPAPTWSSEELDRCEQELSRPEARIAHRLLWFSGDRVLNKYSGQICRQTLEEWCQDLRRVSPPDALVLWLLGLCIMDPALRQVETWSACFEEWVRLLGSDSFWSAARVTESRSGFDPKAMDRHFTELRDQAIGLLLQPISRIVSTAMCEANSETLSQIKSIIELLRVNPHERAHIEMQIWGPVEIRISESCASLSKMLAKIEHRRGQEVANRRLALDAAQRFDLEIDPALRDLKVALAADHDLSIRARNNAAAYLVDLSEALVWGSEYRLAKNVLFRSKDLVPDGALEEDIRKKLREFGD